MHKPKGLLQILWERGYINPDLSGKECVRHYALNGKKDANGDINPETNLKETVSNLPDFKKELTLLQFCAHQLGVTVDCSPKYHPEIVGKGIEFCWGIAKNNYRGRTLAEKKGKENLTQLVRECTCNKSVITIESMRLFGWRIRL